MADDPADQGLLVGELLVFFRLFDGGLVPAVGRLRRAVRNQPRDLLREPEEGAGRRDEDADRVVPLRDARGAASAAPDEPDRVREQGEHRVGVGRGQVKLLGEQEVGGAEQGADDRAADHPQHGQQRQVDGEDEQRVTPVEAARVAVVDRPTAPRAELAVVHDGIGDHLHAQARGLDPPAEVDVVAEEAQRRVETAEPLPHVAPDEHAGRAHGQHGPLVVVLALVDLARVDARDPAARAVDGDAHLAEGPPVLSVEHLGPDDHHGAVPARRPQQPLKRVGGGLAVIVQQPDPLDPGDARVGHSRPPLRRVPQRHRDRLAVAGRRGSCRRPRPGRSARRGRHRCGPGFPCLPRPSAQPGRSGPSGP